MKKRPRLGLVVEGKLTSSALLRYPAILAQLGPVKTKSLRVGRRATNFLDAGCAVDTYDELEQCQLILLHVPPASVRSHVEEIARANLTHSEKAFVLCESWAPADMLSPLAALGAEVLTTVTVTSASGRWCVLEGPAHRARVLRSLIESGPDRVLSLREGEKNLLFAAELLAGVLPLVLMRHAEQALRAGHVPGRQLRSLLDGIGQRMLLDSVAHPSHPAVRSSLRDCPAPVAQSHLNALRQSHPLLAAFLHDQLASPWLSDLFPASATLEEDEQAVSLEVEGA